MTQRRVTATKQLSTVISVIQLGKKTGLLSVERGKGPTFEEGTITFLQGQIVNAVLGSLQSRDAVASLSGWKDCHFSFSQMQPHELGSITNNRMQSTMNTMSSSPHHHTSPSRDSPSFTPVPPIFTHNTGADNMPTQTSGEFPAIHVTRHTDQLYWQSATHTDPLNRKPNTIRTGATIETIIQAMDRQGYSRLHRHLYLLIDGNRSVVELGNLIGRPIDETIAILSDLERAGLIHQER
jgi:hypothetical protein